MQMKRLAVLLVVILVLIAVAVGVTKLVSNSGDDTVGEEISETEKDTSAVSVKYYQVGFSTNPDGTELMTTSGMLYNTSVNTLSVSLDVTVKNTDTGAVIGHFQASADDIKPRQNSPFSDVRKPLNNIRNIKLIIKPTAVFEQ